MAVVGYATIQLIPSLQGFGGAVRGQITPVARQAGSEGGKSAGGFFGNSFVGSVGRIMSAAGIYEIGSRIASGFSDAFKTGLQGVANLQSYSISFETLLGSASKAQDMIKSLYSFAARTPFDVSGSVVGAQKLLGVGVAAKDVIPTLTTLGDAVGALGGSTDDFNSVLLAYSQIMARGKVSTQDLYQISNTGIPIFQLLSKAMGMPVGNLQKLIETGKLASGDVLPKLLAVMNQDYGGAMTKQAGTLSGLWSTFKDTMSQALTTAMTPFATWLQSVLPAATVAATNAIQWISDKLTAVSDWFAMHSAELGPAFQPFADALQNTDWDGLFTAIGTGLGNLLLALAPFAQAVGDFVNTNLPPFVQALSDLGITLGTSVTGGANNATGAMGANSQANDDARAKAQSHSDAQNGLSSNLGSAAKSGTNTAVEMGRVALAMVNGASMTQIMNDVLSGKFGPTLRAQIILAQATGTALRVGFNTAKSAVTTAVTAMVTSLEVLPTKIATVVAQMVGKLTAGITQFATIGGQLIAGLVRGITSGTSSVVSGIKSVVGTAVSVAEKALGIKSPSRVFRGIGAYTVEGFAQGINRNTSSIAKAYSAFAAPSFAPADVPITSADVSAANTATLASAVSTAKGGAYIGAVNFQGSDTNAAMVGDLNFYLRNYARGGR